MANLTSTDAVIIELYDNPLTERPDDRYGRVLNVASIDEDALIKRAVAHGFNGNTDSMKAAYNAMKGEALQAIVTQASSNASKMLNTPRAIIFNQILDGRIN